VYHVPILNFSVPALIRNPSSLGEAKTAQGPAEHHAHLHQRQVLPRTNRPSVPEREERRRVVFSCRCTIAKPSFRYERLGRVEVSRVAVNAVGMEGQLSLFWNEPANTEDS
jgi:hypothetical protein